MTPKKRRVGRPATGLSPAMLFRITRPEIATRLAEVEIQFKNRSEALRTLIEIGLKNFERNLGRKLGS
jgi:hypothetical protein